MGLYEFFFRKPNFKVVDKATAEGDVMKLIELLCYYNKWAWKDSYLMRNRAAAALKTIQDLWSDELLIETLTLPERYLAIEPIATMGEPRGPELLFKLTQDEGFDIRFKAAVKLADFGDYRAIKPLLEVQRKRVHDYYSQSTANKALKNFREPKAVEPLIKALGDEDSGVRRYAVEALEEIGDKRAVEPLIKALGDEDSSVRHYAVKALGNIGDERAVEPLIKALGDEDSDMRMRHYAAEALGNIGDKRAVEPLINVFHDKHHINTYVYNLCHSAINALGKIGDERAVEPLIKALGDKYSDVRCYAAETLGNIGDKRAVEPLIKALGDEDGDVRRYAAETLGNIGDKRAIETIIKYLCTHPWENKGYAKHASSKLRNLFGDYFDIIYSCFSIGEYNEYEEYSYKEGYGYLLGRHYNDVAETSVLQLCKILSPISNNLLHIINKMENIRVTVAWGCGSYREGTLSCEKMRNLACDELQRRGNPPYEPSAFLDEQAYRL